MRNLNFLKTNLENSAGQELKSEGGGKNFFIGIDLGGKEKKTTGICILEENKTGGLNLFLKERIFGREILVTISKYLEKTKVLSIDAPLTIGKGKGKMRLYEKFLSQKLFRQSRLHPIPPAIMFSLSQFAIEIKKKLEKKGFILDINLIETFPTFLKGIVKKREFFRPIIKKRIHFFNEDEEMAFYCATLAFWHANFKTRYFGYKDGFLFLPEIFFWKKKWLQTFYQMWQKRDRLKYRYLITNLFDNKQNE